MKQWNKTSNLHTSSSCSWKDPVFQFLCFNNIISLGDFVIYKLCRVLGALSPDQLVKAYNLLHIIKFLPIYMYHILCLKGRKFLYHEYARPSQLLTEFPDLCVNISPIILKPIVLCFYHCKLNTSCDHYQSHSKKSYELWNSWYIFRCIILSSFFQIYRFYFCFG